MGRRVVAWALVTSMVWTSVAAASPGRRAADHAVARQAEDALPSIPKLAVPDALDLVAVREGAFAVADRYDPRRFFVRDLVEALGPTPEAAFAHVRDRIRFDPYRGILRGVEGTLAAQAGSAYDRSLLLQRLLDDMGLETRLAFGTLPESQARVLLARALQPAPDPFDPEPLERLAGFLPLVRQRLEARAARDYEWLRGSGALTGTQAAGRLVGLEDVRDHVWVQARMEGKWTDLDASFADAVAGRSYTAAARYVGTASEGDHHRVQIALVAESLAASRLASTRVLDVEVAAASAAASTIYLTFRPRNPGLGGTLAAKLGADTEFVPILTVDGTDTTGRPIPGVRPEASASRAFLGAGGRAELAGLYLDVTTTSPGGRTHRSRRTLIDRLPAGARRPDARLPDALAAVSRIGDLPSAMFAVHQILVSTAGLNPHQVASDVGLAAHFAGTYMSQASFDELPLDSQMWPVAMLRRLSLAVNERRALDAVNDREGLRFLIGTPRVYVMSQSQYIRDRVHEVAMRVDLLLDEVVAVAAAEVDAATVAARRTRYGMWQSAFETTLFEIGRQAVGGAAEGLLGASLQSGGSPVVLRSSGDARLPANAPAALVSDLDAGRIVVLSQASIAGGTRTWWSIASDGTTRAMLAPTLGGMEDVLWWWHHTKTRQAGINEASRWYDDLSDRRRAYELAKAEREAYQEALERAYKKGGGRAAAARSQRAVRLPQTRSSRGGATEYGVLLDRSLWSHGYTSIGLGLTIVANVTVAFAALYAYLLQLDIERRTK
jgi:hypothetical protein